MHSTTSTLDRRGTTRKPTPHLTERHQATGGGSQTALSNSTIDSGKMGMVFLGGSQHGCGAGIQPSFPVDFAVHGTGRGTAIRVRTSRPVALVDLYPWTASVPDAQQFPAVPSASLLLPT